MTALSPSLWVCPTATSSPTPRRLASAPTARWAGGGGRDRLRTAARRVRLGWHLAGLVGTTFSSPAEAAAAAMDPQRRLLPKGGCEALRAASLDKTATKASLPSIAQTPRIHSSGALAAAMMAAARAAAAVCMSVLASACARPRLFCARRRSPPPLRAGRCELRVRAACILLAVCFFRGGAGSRSRVWGTRSHGCALSRPHFLHLSASLVVD